MFEKYAVFSISTGKQLSIGYATRLDAKNFFLHHPKFAEDFIIKQTRTIIQGYNNETL